MDLLIIVPLCFMMGAYLLLHAYSNVSLVVGSVSAFTFKFIVGWSLFFFVYYLFKRVPAVVSHPETFSELLEITNIVLIFTFGMSVLFYILTLVKGVREE